MDGIGLILPPALCISDYRCVTTGVPIIPKPTSIPQVDFLTRISDIFAQVK